MRHVPASLPAPALLTGGIARTTYHGPTDTRGSRIQALTPDGVRRYYDYDPALSAAENHARAALDAARAYGVTAGTPLTGCRLTSEEGVTWAADHMLRELAEALARAEALLSVALEDDAGQPIGTQSEHATLDAVRSALDSYRTSDLGAPARGGVR